MLQERFEIVDLSVPLAVGMFARAAIEGKRVEDVVLLPRSAVRDRSRVVIVDEEDRLRMRDVDVLRFEDDQVVSRGGLARGERVLVSPLNTLVEGMPVRPRPAAPETPGEMNASGGTTP